MSALPRLKLQLRLGRIVAASSCVILRQRLIEPAIGASALPRLTRAPKARAQAPQPIEGGERFKPAFAASQQAGRGR